MKITRSILGELRIKFFFFLCDEHLNLVKSINATTCSFKEKKKKKKEEKNRRDNLLWCPESFIIEQQKEVAFFYIINQQPLGITNIKKSQALPPVCQKAKVTTWITQRPAMLSTLDNVKLCVDFLYFVSVTDSYGYTMDSMEKRQILTVNPPVYPLFWPSANCYKSL